MGGRNPVSTAEFLQKTRERGIVLEADGDTLRYRAPKGSLTPELRAAMARHKGEIIAALASGERTGHGHCPGPDRCGGCYPIPGGRYIHPPKLSRSWKDWLAKWEPKGVLQ